MALEEMIVAEVEMDFHEVVFGNTCHCIDYCGCNCDDGVC